jgi:hypothetical protein
MLQHDFPGSPIEKKFSKGYQCTLSNFGKKATSEFKEQLNKVKDKLGAMRTGMYMLVWNPILAKLTGKHPDQSFDDVESKGPPFCHTNHIVFSYGQPYILVLTMRMFWPE